MTKVETENSLEEIFSNFGYPEVIVSDNGPQFRSDEFLQYCRRNAIHRRLVTPLHPRANGEVERFFRTLEKSIWCAINDNKNWRTELLAFLFNYRNTSHSTTGKSPAEIVLGYKPKMNIPSLQTFNYKGNEQRTKQLLKRDAEQKAKSKRHADTFNHARMSKIDVGDTVLLKRRQNNKFQSPYDPVPFTVIQRFGNKVIIKRQNQIFHRNVSLVKLLPKPARPNSEHSKIPVKSKSPQRTTKQHSALLQSFYQGPSVTIHLAETITEPLTTSINNGNVDNISGVGDINNVNGTNYINITHITQVEENTNHTPIVNVDDINRVSNINNVNGINCINITKLEENTTKNIRIVNDINIQHKEVDHPASTSLVTTSTLTEAEIDNVLAELKNLQVENDRTHGLEERVKSRSFKKRQPILLVSDSNREKQFSVNVWYKYTGDIPQRPKLPRKAKIKTVYKRQ